MTLREKILKTFVVTIREVNTHGGVKEFFKKYPVGGLYYSEGAVLTDENGVEMGTAMSHEKMLECKAAAKDLIVCADGVAVAGQKVRFNPQKALGASRNLTDAYNLGKCIGMQCNDKGVDWILAPSIDMCFDHLMYLLGISDDPETIGKVYRQVIKGIQDQGVCSTAKHFPGIGTSFVNMHIGPGANVLPFDEWLKTYGYTYREVMKENVAAIMTTHITLKSYTDERENGFNPIATFSKKITTDLLKGDLGFKGAVVTDALIMGGMATGDLIAETVQAFKAGADLLLWPPVEAAEKIEELIISGEIPMSRLNDALERIEGMKTVKERAEKNGTIEKPNAGFVDEQTLKISKDGMCLLRNDIGLLPLDKNKINNILIVDGTENGGGDSSVLLKEEFIRRGFNADLQRDIYDVPSRVCWQADIDKLQSRYDLVIFNIECAFVAEWSVPHMLIWASHLFDKKKKLIINYGSPYFASDYFSEDPTFIETNCDACRETVKILVDGILGKSEFIGKSIFVRGNE